MNKKISIIGMVLLLLATLVVAQTAEVRPAGVPVLVYGQVIIDDAAGSRLATSGDGVTYTITTYNVNAPLGIIAQRTGTVGTMRTGYVFESQNQINNDGDIVVVQVRMGNLTAQTQRAITHLENYRSFMNFGILTLKSEVIVIPEKEMDMYIHTVKFISDEYLVIGEELITNTMLDNVGDIDLEQVTINVLIQDLGVRRKVGPVDIDVDDSVNNDVYIEIPDWAQPGDYDVRITISNDDMRRVVYRMMTVE